MIEGQFLFLLAESLDVQSSNKKPKIFDFMFKYSFYICLNAQLFSICLITHVSVLTFWNVTKYFYNHYNQSDCVGFPLTPVLTMTRLIIPNEWHIGWSEYKSTVWKLDLPHKKNKKIIIYLFGIL